MSSSAPCRRAADRCFALDQAGSEKCTWQVQKPAVRILPRASHVGIPLGSSADSDI